MIYGAVHFVLVTAKQRLNRRAKKDLNNSDVSLSYGDGLFYFFCPTMKGTEKSRSSSLASKSTKRTMDGSFLWGLFGGKRWLIKGRRVPLQQLLTLQENFPFLAGLLNSGAGAKLANHPN